LKGEERRRAQTRRREDKHKDEERTEERKDFAVLLFICLEFSSLSM
jgi:hypothetical protein